MGSTQSPITTSDFYISSRHEHFEGAALTSPNITLEVGPIPVLFTAHKAVLTRCKYFVKCLEPGKFEEGVSNRIRLPDECPKDMERMLGFLYTGKLLRGDSSDSDTVHEDILWGPVGDWISYLIQYFFIADRFCVDDMCDQVIEVVQTSIPARAFRWRHLEKLNEAGLRGSTLWQAVLKIIARGFERAERQVDLDKLMNDGLASNPEICSDLLREIANLVKQNPSISCCKYSGGWDGWGCNAHKSQSDNYRPYPTGVEL